MGTSIHITTPIPSAEEVADDLGLSKERRKFLSDLALTAKTQRPLRSSSRAGNEQKSSSSQKRSLKKAS